MERRLLSERTRAGLAAAREHGSGGGRPTVMTPERIDAARTLHTGGQSMTQIAKNFGVSRATVSRALSATRATATPV